MTEASENQRNFVIHILLAPYVTNAAYMHIQIHHHNLRFMKEIVAVPGEKKHAEIPTHGSLSIKSSRKSIDKAEKSER